MKVLYEITKKKKKQMIEEDQTKTWMQPQSEAFLNSFASHAI